MSIIVEDVDIPTSCYRCPAFHYDDEWCGFLSEFIYYSDTKDTGRPEWCPMKPYEEDNNEK